MSENNAMMPENNDEQSALWNGPAGETWVETQPVIDGLLQPFADLLVDAVTPRDTIQRVLDVGCGTGATTLALARKLGGQVRCTGLDISEPMTALARRRAAQEGVAAEFQCADAQTYPFQPGSFDLIQSRFGVMFFADPVGAFANLRRAAADGGTLRFIAWRSPAENAFMTAAERAAAPLLPEMPPRQPNAPGQFAFADGERVREILEAAGWAEVILDPIDVDCSMAVADLEGYFTRFGPVGMALKDADPRKRAEVIATVRAAFDPFVEGDQVRCAAACWMVRARAGSAR